ncbi:Multicopper oxidase [Marinobacter nitratireducens]|uniref:Multicopper oxidase n=1 Tax=Marinobacter nitratireducens TaxID=1137280 RepID=A0A072N273_9GAMM|nr:copper resistance system multicopper oxidase [Marinobacter nitratireducens]KEF31784.1 Multicopper oxidase [Marinobacter nitratireducens]
MTKSLVAGALGLLMPALALAGEYNISVDRVMIDTGDFVKEGIGYNGSSPGPVLRFKEGEDVTINVTNNLDEATSIHWHGLILPFDQDGVPGISFAGIPAGETFTYTFPVVQSGTYWFHSHSGFQEPNGAYGSIVIEPKGREPFRYDREYVVQLTDKHPHDAARVMRNLKMMPDYYNRKQQTVGDFFSDVSEHGFMNALSDRMAWGDMRMMKADVEDVQGFTGLINGKGPDQNWTGLFEPGERIRLRFINSSAMAYFDVRIPGLDMTVVQADGNNVQPVTVDEFRIGVAETYDVIVRPKTEEAFTIFAESMGRSGYARATLAPREGMEGPIPSLRDAPLLTMADMGGMHGMDHGSMDMGEDDMAGMDHSSMADDGMKSMGDNQMDHSSMAGMDHGSMMMSGNGAEDPFYAKGSGLVPTAANGGKFLSYADLKAQKPLYEDREPTREIELRLTGNMERYSWSINGVKYEDAEAIKLQYGERVRFKFVNETMMTHPMHLHGMWSILDTGAGKWNPVKHTISVQPGTTVFMETEVDAPGQWAFHCHLSYHAASGMFRKVVVEGGPDQGSNAGVKQEQVGGDV